MSAGRRVKCRRCGDVIQSMHRHDFKWCECRAIAVDGGSDYLRTTGHLTNMEFLEHEVVEVLQRWKENRASWPAPSEGAVSLANYILNTSCNLCLGNPTDGDEVYAIAIAFARGADEAGML